MTKQLHTNVKTFWTAQHNSGAKGLALLVDTINHTANTGDWTAMARFMSRAGTDRRLIAPIIMAAFGQAIEWKADKKSEFGGKFVKKWDGAQFDLAKSNSFPLVLEAIEQNKSFRSEDFQKALRAQAGRPEKAAPKADELVKAVAKYLVGKAKAGDMDTGKLIAAVQAELKEQAAKA